MINICFIGGLGQNPRGDLDGFRCFAEMLVNVYGIAFHAYSHADRNLGPIIAELPGELILVGYSNGGAELIETVDPYLAHVGRPVHAICLIDAKQEWSSIGGFFRWVAGADFPTPKSTALYHAFRGGFGRGFKGGVETTRVDCSHAKFPAHPKPHEWIADRVKELAARNPITVV